MQTISGLPVMALHEKPMKNNRHTAGERTHGKTRKDLKEGSASAQSNSNNVLQYPRGGSLYREKAENPPTTFGFGAATNGR